MTIWGQILVFAFFVFPPLAFESKKNEFAFGAFAFAPTYTTHQYCNGRTVYGKGRGFIAGSSILFHITVINKTVTFIFAWFSDFSDDFLTSLLMYLKQLNFLHKKGPKVYLSVVWFCTHTDKKSSNQFP
jgi:hypothetical protein